MADQTDIVDAKETSLAAVTDDSHTAHFSEIVPLERASHDYFKPEFIEPVVEVKPEDLQDVKHRPSDDYCKAEFIDRVVEVKPEYSYEVYCIWLLLALHYTKLTSRSPCQFVGYPFTG